jgi:iron complex outermembrane receptor protein
MPGIVLRRLVVLVALVVLAANPAHAQGPDSSTTDTLQHVVTLPPIEVSTTRADPRQTQPHAVIERQELQRRNIGQDTPMLLATTPGAYAYSDAGNGIGYSYLSIRGFPQRRISVLINGVPLNDPESHEVYWIDHPDLLASTTEAQVQRGVGSALYGAASLGGSVNLETSPLSEASSLAATYGFGSFATKRFMVEGGSGVVEHGIALYGRYSRIETDGYRDQSDSKLWSYLLAAEKRTDRHRVRVNLYGGPEETHLAYLGIPRATLDGGLTGDPDQDRRFNPLTYPNERDHFFEPHYELIHTWRISDPLSLTQTAFYFDGDGYYDEQRFGVALADYRLTPWLVADSTLYSRDHYQQNPDGSLTQDAQGRFTVERSDIVRRREVKNRHYGWVPRLRWEQGPHGALTVGGEIRAHDGRHIGTVIQGTGLPPGTEPDHDYYDYHPRTLAAGVFVRQEWQGLGAALRDLRVVADLAWRHQGYEMRGDQFDGVRFDQDYDFAIPRLALQWRQPANRWWLTGSASHSRREPAFRDLYDAEGVGSAPLFDANGDPLIKPEQVMDYELGAHWSDPAFDANLNLFRMDFHDELVYAGQFNTDLGYPILGNAARSLHQGVEIEASAWLGRPVRPGGEPAPGHAFADGHARELRISANAAFADNHFIEYQEAYGPLPSDIVHYDGNPIGFFPATLANLRLDAARYGIAAGIEAQYAGRIFVDNTGTDANSIDPRTVVNASASTLVRPGSTALELSLRVQNVFDKRYETSGYLDYDATGNLVPTLVPAATRNWIAQVTLRL